MKRLIALNHVPSREDQSHSQKVICSLAALPPWGRRHLPVCEELSIGAKLFEEGGEPMWNTFVDELRRLHVDDPVTGANVAIVSPVLAEFTNVYEAARARTAFAG
ncbi:hypothetical protein [Stappia sp. MMSF_3263]|uniref:hypothetical protein n=1 Tax=Stappia sp. MMSF_3263 TaxID=3046693 RepID=UPI00273D7B99|nr:hypothetical protein [Stappia sp. MMSF_3263]